MIKDCKCKDCIHRGNLGGLGGDSYWACLYILDTKKARPCPAGDDCTVFSTGQEVSKGRDMHIVLEGSN